jgi:hypothetical protein
MVNHCANVNCCKPLQYLREGRIYVFDVPSSTVPISSSAKGARHIEHFWLCGSCSETMVIEKTPEGLYQTAQRGKYQRASVQISSVALAS